MLLLVTSLAQCPSESQLGLLQWFSGFNSPNSSFYPLPIQWHMFHFQQ